MVARTGKMFIDERPGIYMPDVMGVLCSSHILVWWILGPPLLT